MTNRKSLTLPLVILALAACSQEPEDTPAVQEEPVEKVIPADHAETPGTADVPPQQQVDAIPVAFVGAWDFVEGSCDPASDLRMDIRPREIEFYESQGTVTSVTLENPQSIVVALDMTGEGESWQITNRFVLSEDEAILTPLETEGDSEFQPMPRKRCPA